MFLARHVTNVLNNIYNNGHLFSYGIYTKIDEFNLTMD